MEIDILTVLSLLSCVLLKTTCYYLEILYLLFYLVTQIYVRLLPFRHCRTPLQLWLFTVLTQIYHAYYVLTLLPFTLWTHTRFLLASTQLRNRIIGMSKMHRITNRMHSILPNSKAPLFFLSPNPMTIGRPLPSMIDGSLLLMFRLMLTNRLLMGERMIAMLTIIKFDSMIDHAIITKILLTYSYSI